MIGEPDETVRLPRPPAGRRPVAFRALPLAALVLVAAGLGAAGAWWALRSGPAPAPVPQAVIAPAPPLPQQVAIVPPQPAPSPVAPPQVAPAPETAPRPAPPPPAAQASAPVQPPLATETEILADAPDTTSVYRFGPLPDIVVLQFATLAAQGRMLNRVAALIEKAGFPRDRVVSDAELDTGIRASGATPETFYYGHDYPAGALVRFFALAAGVTLNEDERRLKALITELGWREDGAPAALISLVRQSPAEGLDLAARATILRHELSHGVFFTDPAYARFVYQFWNTDMTERDRAKFTAFLGKEGYDPALRELIINETQAYLMYTADRRFFSATSVGLAESRIDELRHRFLAEMPPGWLRDVTTVPPSNAAFPPLMPARAPRQRQGRGLVRTIRTPVARRVPRRFAASRAARNSRT